MKRTISALMFLLVLGSVNTAWAEANPFSDVPADHWAYDAILQLSENGGIQGYGDDTFRGGRSLTRYEMAQMVARAMVQRKISDQDKTLLNKLTLEFGNELSSLGIRMDNLERNADRVKWTGKVEYTAVSNRIEEMTESGREKFKDNFYDLLLRLEPSADINDHWTVHARLDSRLDLEQDTAAANVRLRRAWVQGDFGDVRVKFGRHELNTNEKGGGASLVWDTNYSGASVEIGKNLKGSIMGGRLNRNAIWSSVGYVPYSIDYEVPRDTVDFVGVNVQYDTGQKLYGGAGYYRVKSDSLKALDNELTEDKGDIWSLNAGYHFSDKAVLGAAYAQNTKADYQDKSWQVQFTYGNYDDAKEKGSWNAYAAYRSMGTGVSLAANHDGVMLGTRGFEIGAAYAPFRNVGFLIKYFDGKSLHDDENYARKLFGRLEMFF